MVYKNARLTEKDEIIDGKTEITINKIRKKYTKITYSGTKTGYVRTSAILLNTTGNTYKSKAEMTAYRRPGDTSYGHIANGDKVMVLGTYGNYTQVRYLASGRYKYAFVSTYKANRYIIEKPTLTSKNGAVVIGGTKTIKVKNASKATFTYKSSKKAIATVSKKGKVTGIQGGSTEIIVTVKQGGQKTKLTYKIDVKKPTLSKSNVSLTSGKTINLTVKDKPKTATYTWSSSNNKIATVNKNGTMTAKENGTATITVKIKTSKKTYSLSCKVTIKSISDNSSDLKQTYTVTFNSNDGTSDVYDIISVAPGHSISSPNNPTRNGYTFFAWSLDANIANVFDFNSTIEKNTDLYAIWIDLTNNIDSNNDGIPDNIKILFGLDPDKADTDGDGLTDYTEIYILSLDPSLVDTDGNGINDDLEDNDDDGLTNAFEISFETNPIDKDTDDDGLSDGDEINTYLTNPLNPDSDDDGASDGVEIRIGSNPLVYENSFLVTESSDDGNCVNASVSINLDGKQVETLNVEQFENDTFLTSEMPGYIGSAYNFSVDGSFDSATISFEFDKTSLSQNADPTIYYFDSEEQTLTELDTIITGNIASAKVTHFSTYVLIDRTAFNEISEEFSYTWCDEWNSDINYKDVELVLVIDDSGSMKENDSYYKRLSVARDLVDNLPENSKVGIVKFTNHTSLLTENIISNKDNAKLYLTTDYFISNGGTKMFTAIKDAIPLFENTEVTTLKCIVVLCDGETDDTSLNPSVTTLAKDNNIKVYTVGLGNSTSYFNNYLKPIANETGGDFYLASNADELNNIFNDINARIDLETDSDGDGISDFYEDHMMSIDHRPLKLDKNNADTDGDGLLDGEELKVVLNTVYNEDKTKATVTVSCKMLSNPTFIDSDGDGLLDNSTVSSYDNIIAPKDPEPLKYTGAKNMWKTHINNQKADVAASNYSTGGGLNFDLPDYLDSFIVATSAKLNTAASNEDVEKILSSVFGIIKSMFAKKWFGSDIFTYIGAKLLNFVPDDKGIAYHSQPNTWQRDFGYNEFYDQVFKIGTNDNMGARNVIFDVDGTDYALWFWKGDYWQLRSGAEIGLYTYSTTHSGVDQYDAIDYELPMSLYLYNYYSSSNIKNVFSWTPIVEQWWITGFNPSFEEPSPDKMVSIGSIDFSSKPNVYNALKSQATNENSLIFGDDYTIWLSWFGRVGAGNGLGGGSLW